LVEVAKQMLLDAPIAWRRKRSKKKKKKSPMGKKQSQFYDRKGNGDTKEKETKEAGPQETIKEEHYQPNCPKRGFGFQESDDGEE